MAFIWVSLPLPKILPLVPSKPSPKQCRPRFMSTPNRECFHGALSHGLPLTWDGPSSDEALDNRNSADSGDDTLEDEDEGNTLIIK